MIFAILDLILLAFVWGLHLRIERLEDDVRTLKSR